MRRTVLAAVAAAAAFAAPVSAQELVHVRTWENGVAVGVGPQANPIVGAGASTDGYACVVVGMSRDICVILVDPGTLVGGR